MCLFTQWAKPQVAEEDIECWKILYEYPEGHVDSGGHPYEGLRGIYYGMQYKEDTEFSEGLGSPDKISEFKGQVSYGLHTVKPEYMVAMMKHEMDCNHISAKVVALRCIIPKGALYYYGADNSGYSGYCSNKLKTLKVKRA